MWESTYFIWMVILVMLTALTLHYLYSIIRLLFFSSQPVLIGLFVTGYFTAQQILYLVGCVFFVLAILIYIVVWIFRTRCEFAVTNNRFIQKDGILILG